MGQSCEISFDKGVPKGKTHPKLMRDILVDTNNNVKSAIALYGVTLTKEFKELGIKKPTLSNVKGFLEQSNIIHSEDAFTKEEKQLLTELSTRFKGQDGMLLKLNEALKEDGVYKLSTDRLYETGLFSNGDLVFIEEKSDLLESIHYKIEKGIIAGKSSDYEFVFNPVTGFLREDIEFNNTLSLDASTNSTNPEVITHEMLNEYAGVNSIEDLKRRAERNGHIHILENEAVMEKLFNIAKDLQPLVSYRYDGENLVKVVNDDMLQSLEQGLNLNQDLEEVTDFLEDVLDSGEVTIEDVNDIADYLKEKGIDIQEIKNVSITDKVVDLLHSLYIMLKDIITGKINMSQAIRRFVNDFKRVVGRDEIKVKKITEKLNKTGIFLHVDTTLSEQEMFFRWGLVKVKDGVYQRFSDTNSTNVEELYEMLYDKGNSLPDGFLTKSLKPFYKNLNIESIRSKVKDMAYEYVTKDFPMEDAEKLVMYKILSNNLDVTNMDKNYSITNKSLDTSTFTSDIYTDILNNEELSHLLHLTVNGLEAKVNLGQYSIAVLKNNLSEDLFNDLVDYAKITGIESLRPLTELNNDEIIVKDRNYYANNMHLLNNYRGVYEVDGDYLRTISNDEFLKVGEDLYERVGEYTYGKVVRKEHSYNFDLEKPEVLTLFPTNKFSVNKVDNSTLGDDKSVTGVVKVSNNNNSGVEFC